jgi:hypothetical protein
MKHRPMNHRSRSVAFLLIALFALNVPALAGESGPTPEQLADWQQRLDQAAVLQAEGKAVRSAAPSCWSGRSKKNNGSIRISVLPR